MGLVELNVFRTVVPSSVSDMVSAIDSFLVDSGWTQDQLNLAAGKAAWHKSTVYVSFRWESSSSLYLGIYHALGFISTSTDPGNHTSDSGNGNVSGTDSVIAVSRRALVGPAPLQLWCFSDDVYAHFVVHQTGSRFTHFGFGILDKVGDWTGGEYCYGQRQQFGFDTAPIREGSTHLLDGLAKSGGSSPQPSDMELYVATVHMAGFTNQSGSSKWGVCMSSGQSSAVLGTDRAGNARVHVLGGYRSGPIATPFGNFAGAATDGHVPQYPIAPFYYNRTTEDVTLLGFLKDVRGCSVQHFDAGDTIVRGTDTWIMFPSGEKWVSGDLTNTTGYQGISYRVVS